MSYPKYYATYCVMDGEAGANPFWHACLLLSTQESEKSPVQVIDSVGFYSQPSTTTNPFIKAYKYVLGFRVDLQDSHGILKQEYMRDLDGNGLHGVSFSATKEQFEQLKSLCTEKIKDEQKAIAELNLLLHNEGVWANGYTRFIKEKSLAELQERAPRLKPFHITMTLNSNGFDSSDSYACKNYALDLLLETNIINEATKTDVLGHITTRAFPRFCGVELTPMRLVSTGEPEKEISKRTGRVFYNRKWGEKNKLLWATPVQENQPITRNELRATEDRHQIIKNMLTRIRKPICKFVLSN